jgi:hypothetical protein
MKYFRPVMLLVATSLFGAFIFAGCATVGHDFDVSQVPRIQMNKTTQAEVQEMFGAPWRVGVDDGRQTWTYGKYHYSLFEEASTTDLVIRFDDKGVVSSYTYNTTERSK